MSRTLVWDGCLNARDLGGLAAANGSTIRERALVRAASLGGLTAEGWDALVADGVRRIVDLRWRAELDAHGYEAPIEVVHISLLGDEPSDDYMAEFLARTEALEDGAEILAAHYVDMLDLHGPEFARVVDAVADAPDGAVCVHCAGGKDRTGMVTALLLSVAGVAADEIASDYALSGPNLLEAWDAQAFVDEATDERDRRWRLTLTTTPADAMLRVLAEVERRWGGAAAYLREAGVADEALERVRVRLVAP